VVKKTILHVFSGGGGTPGAHETSVTKNEMAKCLERVTGVPGRGGAACQAAERVGLVGKAACPKTIKGKRPREGGEVREFGDNTQGTTMSLLMYLFQKKVDT